MIPISNQSLTTVMMIPPCSQKQTFCRSTIWHFTPIFFIHLDFSSLKVLKVSAIIIGINVIGFMFRILTISNVKNVIFLQHRIFFPETHTNSIISDNSDFILFFARLESIHEIFGASYSSTISKRWFYCVHPHSKNQFWENFHNETFTLLSRLHI